MKSIIRSIAVFLAVFAGALLIDGATHQGFIVERADARVGRPLTPVSVAGVARRTTRRTIARTSVYVSTLPASCRVVVVENVSVHQCGGTYYQPYGNQYVVVNVY
jgi:hypothetical protein